jgi:hypothetical protein
VAHFLKKIKKASKDFFYGNSPGRAPLVAGAAWPFNFLSSSSCASVPTVSRSRIQGGQRGDGGDREHILMR